EHGYVALMHLACGGAEVLMQDRAVNPAQPGVDRVDGVLGVVQRPFDLATQRDELAVVRRVDPQPGGCRVEAGVDGPAVGDGDGRLATGGAQRDAGDEYVTGYVDKIDGHRAPAVPVNPCRDPPGGNVDDDVGTAVPGGLHHAGVHRPGTQGDGAVPAGGGKAVLVPEQHA